MATRPMATLPAAITLMGPTASGKTDLALQIAEHHAVEIISVDSAQVYRYMDVGTAKPEAWMRARVPHHLIDIADPTESYSAGQFHAQALTLMREISARGRMPLLVGGTMLYFNALRQGLNALPTADSAVRAMLDARAQAVGWPALHAELARIDAPSAARIAPNDSQRIQRALEVFELTGSPLSTHHATPRDPGLSHRLIELALIPADRVQLHQRIAQRFDGMLRSGLVDEVERLKQQFPLTSASNAMRCVGYRQAWQHLEGVLSREDMRDKGVAATRQLAKRQLTWLRAMPTLLPLDPFDPALVHRALAAVESALG